ncbi:ADP-ribose 1''-phosphate phosphatase [Scheffersomyces xylosifermentans]|uniref:ADP-ribose 1''-phosphate phosphatase n=1 Tax=Scheffersomyces xylosifermentans TaxID=1304137 RepID=UPI00315C689B
MIRYIKGDLLGHIPTNPKAVSILAHACNCHGSWGGGIANVIRRKFPSTYSPYSRHCQDLGCDPSKLLGTSIVIPSESTDSGNIKGLPPKYIACLFTSDFSESSGEIVGYTEKAVKELLRQLEELRSEVSLESEPDGRLVVNMPKINAGIFNVPWEKTEAVLKKVEGVQFNVYVFE